MRHKKHNGLLSIFRNNQLLVSFLLLFYVLALHVFMVIMPGQTSQLAYGILFPVVKGWIPESLYWQAGVVVLLLFIQAFMLNILEYNYRFNRDVNMYAGVFFLLFTSFSSSFQTLSPIHFSNIFLFIALYELMDISKKHRPEGNIFNAGFCIGIAALFYPVSALYLILVLISLNVLRGIIFRERLVALSGFLVVYFLAASISYQLDALPDFMGHQFSKAYKLFDLGKMRMPWELIPWIIILLGIVFNQGDFFQKQNMLTQKRIGLLYWMVFIGLATIVVTPGMTTEHLLLAALPIGFLTGMFFGRLRSKWAELWHFMLLLGLLLIQYQPLIIKYLS